MRKLAFFILAGLVSGCVTPPQTTDELREGVKKGAAMTKTEQAEFKRPFFSVYTGIKSRSDRCLNVTLTGSTPGTYGPVRESIRYRSSSMQKGDQRAETVLQMDKKATGAMPEGGYFVMLAEVESLSGGKTRVTIYGPSMGYNNVYESILAWARGEDRKCPKFPNGGSGWSFTYHNK